MAVNTIVCAASGHRYAVVSDFNEVCWLAVPLFGRDRRPRLLRKAGCVVVEV